MFPFLHRITNFSFRELKDIFESGFRICILYVYDALCPLLIKLFLNKF